MFDAPRISSACAIADRIEQNGGQLSARVTTMQLRWQEQSFPVRGKRRRSAAYAAGAGGIGGGATAETRFRQVAR